jgi:hypothetical protein
MMAFSATACLLLTCFTREANGFAYAPNFITKMIKEETGLEPIGLLAPAENEAANPQEPKSTTQQKVTTRFPPEPNGYLHLGHAKAVSFNFAVARMFHGDCHMRLDDTNPSKEDEEYVASILEDVQWIQSGLVEPGQKPWSGSVRKTSDYFDQIYDCAVSLIKSGDAYVDSLSAEEMREYRGSLTEPGKNSPYRTRTIEENLELFEGVSSPSAFSNITGLSIVFHSHIVFLSVFIRCEEVNFPKDLIFCVPRLTWPHRISICEILLCFESNTSRTKRLAIPGAYTPCMTFHIPFQMPWKELRTRFVRLSLKIIAHFMIGSWISC